ncbi:hypothetical protein BDA96_09G060300 [Sorghum bicolor]|uniref:Secreted protein n=1 Tax=Sorghum bicolor TaxID=4558 RepID=A0A921QAV5_SORBI|nr:hypothetical protein BDA96_09G060300 [Sorghum bicolor]
MFLIFLFFSFLKQLFSFWAIECTIWLSKFVCGSEISVCNTGISWIVVHMQIIVAYTQIADLKGITSSSKLSTNIISDVCSAAGEGWHGAEVG